jgi:predicted RNA-binding protein with PIN domain
MHILVDGYNLIGSETGLTGNLELKRNQLIQKLQAYSEQKGYSVTLVFDGWRGGWSRQSEQKSGGIHIIFSRLGEKADEVIKRLAKEWGSGCVVVTSDREIRNRVEAHGAVSIHAGEFVARLSSPDREVSFEEPPEESGGKARDKKGNPRKLSKIERRRRERLKKL